MPEASLLPVTSAAEALELLKTRVPIMPGLALGVLAAAGSLGNVYGIYRARTNWLSVAARLDGGWKAEIASVLAASRSDWIGSDHDTFEKAMEDLLTETEAVRAYFNDIAKHLDEIGDVLLAFEIEFTLVVAFVIAYSTIYLAMLATPASAPWAAAALQFLGARASSLILFMSQKVVKFIGLATATIGVLAPNIIQFNTLEARGEAAIDFTRLYATTSPPLQFIEPIRNVAEPIKNGQPPPSAATPETVTIRPGSGMTLWKIAEQKYGDGRLWTVIYEANRNLIFDPDHPPEGLPLVIPPKPKN